MVSKAQIQLVKSLSLSKFRQKYDKFTAEGEKTVIEFLKSKAFPVSQIFVTGEKKESNPALTAYYPHVEWISDKEMAAMTSFKTHSGVLAVFDKIENLCSDQDIQISKTLYLDDVQDPGNMGTMVRIADWFGIKNIIRSSGSADFFHPKVIQATMGSLCNVKTRTDTLENLAKLFPKLEIMGADLQGIPVHHNTKWPKHGILVIGNEGHGISESNKRIITKKLSITGSPDKIAESLNAAMATSIFCHLWSHQEP